MPPTLVVMPVSTWPTLQLATPFLRAASLPEQ
jgi:hypothetical protein